MLPVIGPIPAHGDKNYVPQDSMLKTIIKDAESAGFLVDPSHFSGEANTKDSTHSLIN